MNIPGAWGGGAFISVFGRWRHRNPSPKLLLGICVFAVEGRKRREEKGMACVRRLEEVCGNERNLIQDGTENSSFCSAKDT